MPEECNETSIATSPATLNWWPDLHVSSLSSWSSNTNTNNNNPWQPQNPNSNSSGEEDVSISTSFTNASNQSSLSVDLESSRHIVESASANELIGKTASDNQLWSHVLLSIGTSGELNNTQEIGHNNILSSKGLSTGMMFEPACDYLKKMDNSWEFTNPQSVINNFEKHFNGFNEGLIESERLNKLPSSLVNNWSIAPPDSEINSSIYRFSAQPDICHSKQSVSNPTTFSGSINRNSGSYSCYGHEMKVKDEHREIEYQLGLYNSILGDSNKYYYGLPDVPCNGTRSFGDAMSSNSFLSKPIVGVHASKPSLRSLSLSDCKKQGIQASSHPTISTTSHTVTRSNGRGGQGIASEGKKKRSEDNSETPTKKPKHDTSSTLSSSKMQVTKVKLGDKITALQQIVSPFGKTDTASVLGEAIGYIKFLQEQVQMQLLSNPYMKSNVNKMEPWGGLDRNERGGDVKVDLKSRGLCLVPISCTPQVCRDNTGSDYWTPTYRGCLYR
ncbi:transcription factor bHLH111 isoform X1 [Camellia sinensis]|uniref:transcription factor bHLH111 isoform X1 n=1 Tax=Camellia sinensis TaxID=4442 RepID=UPI001035E711|nr:transcription factor bHLH111 isoform X1 [Camellia sinensis]